MENENKAQTALVHAKQAQEHIYTEQPRTGIKQSMAAKIAAFLLCAAFGSVLVIALYDVLLFTGWFVGICVLGLIGTFAFLMRSAGHRRGVAGIRLDVISKIPLDLLSVLLLFFVYFLLVFVSWIHDLFLTAEENVLILTMAFAVVSLALGWCISLAIRIKSGTLLTNNLTYKILRWIWRQLKKTGQLVSYAKRNASLLVKIGAAFAVWQFLAGLLFAILDGAPGLAYWVLDMVLTAGMLYALVMFRRIQISGREIAKGNFSYRADTKHMVGGFREHAENLNRIRSGMSGALEERLKSERLKTELITNVSHDLKTPLTSIINYSDLIKKENCDNEKIAEYIEVISRQSERMKKLVLDLIELSKATTGNIEVALAPCDVGIFLSQAAGEYTEKLLQHSLDLIMTKSEGAVLILADGKLLWRVLDNLIDNVCKYALPGTRVYLSLEEAAQEVVLSIKNTSKSPLNIKAEELMERFVRGDSSRHTEGSGLGLSIAGSLMELQLGKLAITIDGDYFRADLHFQTA
jgi:signal transduction histidine kinase